ncbi:hypothetical protein MMC12_007895 [Toensbergia leucococca]|nr:hypothetical protein [Toensbergia leucococca]
MTCKELPAQAANINRAIGSPTTCTPSTVEALRLYLSPKPVPEPQPVRPFVINRRPKSQQLAVQDSRRRGAGKRKTPEVAILEVPQNGPNFAQPHERFALATEVVNATLKALTDAIKRPIAPQKLPPKQLTKSPSSSSISSSRQKEKPKPLQPRCVNRISNLPGERTRSRRSSSVLSVRYAPGLLFQAECARIAFATLRSIQSQKISGIEMPYLQLETGMSVLIGKLIALDLIDLAVKELRILKKRLDGLLGSSSTSSNATSTDVLTSGSKQETHKETLADLLHFPIASDTGPILAMVVTLQLQVLKIVAIKNRPDIIENAFNHLKLSTPYSPVNLILRQASTDAPESQLKKARQLETLAQSLLSLCPSVSSGEDEKAVDPKISLAPEAALNLQLLALEIRLRWWKLSCHQGDIAKEMAEPFTKCLISFRRRSRLSIEETYKKAQSAFKAFVRFVDAGTDGTTLASSSRGSAFLEIYSLISDLAQEILKYNEAIHWTMVSTEILISTAASQSRICAYKCRIAMLNLYASKTTLNNQDLSKSLEEASKELQGDLQGDSTELDGLLLAVASLRKAAFPVLHDYYRTPETIKAKHSPQIIDQCFNLLLQSLEFVSRYVGRSLTPGEAGRTTLRYEQRKRLASNVAGPLIESVVAIGRLSMGSNTDIWSRIDTALQRCACLASSLEDPKSRTESKSNENPEPLLFTLLSNAYWARYLHLKHVKADPRELRRILRRSIDLINQRPINDRTAGFLPTKLEAYGMICEISRDYKKATEAYAEGIKNQIDIGLLDIATEGAISQSLPQVLSTDGALSGLGRLLLAYPRVALKRSEQGPELEVIFDRETLPPAGRGLLLEQQLNAVTSILQAYGPSTELCQALRYLAISIFSVYTETEFPIRRLRVLILFLRINSTHPSALGNTLLDMLLQKQNTESKSEASDADLGLRRFVGYLDASWTMSVAFSNERPDLQAVQSTLTAWSSMLQGCSDWQSLQTHVDDISGWLVQLESVAEYLDMQGLSIMRISALQQLVIIHELMPSSPFAAPVSWLSALGLQYVHLGYSGKAHNALQKAQNYLETTCTSPQDATKLFLAYAEYSLEIGNLTKWSVASRTLEGIADRR